MIVYLTLFYYLIVLLQIAFFAGLLSRFSFVSNHISGKKTAFEKPVSVIVACRNESARLPRLLPALLQQDYPLFEIVLVNDASTDDTESILRRFATENSGIRYLSIKPTAQYKGDKKTALTKGIELARYEHLLFTDADCIPASPYWIDRMMRSYKNDAQIVLGYGAYQKQKGLLNKMIRYETLLTAWQYFSYALSGIPYMGVGRNMSYTKTLFRKVSGFEKHKNIRSGDDDLFVNQAANNTNTALCWEKQAHTISIPPERLSQWIHQKSRHISTATSYRLLHRFLLALFYSTQFFFFALLFIIPLSKSVIFLALVRYTIYFITLHFVIRKLNEKDLFFWAPLLEIFLVVFQMYLFIQNRIYKPKTW